MIGRRAMMGAAGRGGGGSGVKSVVFDFSTRHSSGGYVGVRRFEFVNGGTVIPMEPTTDFLAYATSYYIDGYPRNAFNTSLLKTGAASNGWTLASSSAISRLIIVFNEPQEFSQIIFNNYHVSGENTNQGMKGTKITISPDTITDTTYNATVSNGTVIFSGDLPKHATTNTAQDYEIPITI